MTTLDKTAVEAACEASHDAYELAALKNGWATNPRSRKPWADVPEENKATVRAGIEAAIAAYLDILSSIPEQGVKALEWRKSGKTSWTANALGFEYVIQKQNAIGDVTFGCWVKSGFGVSEYVEGGWSKIAPVKAAAQSHWDRAIRSALAPSHPAAVAVTDEMVERATEALAQSFRDTVARVSGESWEDTGVTLPSKDVFERYARDALEAALVDRDRVK